MAYFTESNTEGFTADELREMNRALDILAAEGYENIHNHISDIINNAYQPGKKAGDYVEAYRQWKRDIPA